MWFFTVTYIHRGKTVTKEQLLNNLKKIADIIVAFWGKNCEVVIHDLSCLEHSLVYVAGSVTCREVGAPATDFLVRHLEQHASAAPDVLPYANTAPNGHPLKSAFIYIRDKHNRPCFALCFNYNIGSHLDALELLAEQTRMHVPTNADFLGPDGETFSKTIEETSDVIVNSVLKELGKHPGDLNREERIDLVCRFQRAGAFRIKGMIERVAELMGISKYTVYSYRKHCSSLPKA